MSTISDRARDFWDGISARERRLVAIGGIALPVTLAIWLGLSIRDGLEAMEQRNHKARKALAVLADLRARGEVRAKVDDVVATMTTEPLPLETYLDNAAKKAQFTLKGVSPRSKTPARNGFVTTTLSCSLDDLTIEQVKSFLTEIETGSRLVAITRIELKRDLRDKTKLDVKALEVSTYSKEPTAKPQEAPAGSADKKGP